MAIASAAGAPPPAWLDTLGKIAGVILGFELIVVLVIICALMVGLVFALHWLNTHVVPVLHENAPKAQRVLALTEQNADRVVGGVAEFYGRRQAVRTGIRVLLFGRQSARRLHEESQIQAATDLDLMETDTSTLPDTENGAAERGGHRQNESRPMRHSAPTADQPDAETHDNHNGSHEYSPLAGNAG